MPKYSRMVKIHLSEETYRAFVQEAASRDIPMSQLGREILEDQVKINFKRPRYYGFDAAKGDEYDEYDEAVW